MAEGTYRIPHGRWPEGYEVVDGGSQAEGALHKEQVVFIINTLEDRLRSVELEHDAS